MFKASLLVCVLSFFPAAGIGIAATVEFAAQSSQQTLEGRWVYIGMGEDPMGDLVHRWRWTETGEIQYTYNKEEPPPPSSDVPPGNG